MVEVWVRGQFLHVITNYTYALDFHVNMQLEYKMSISRKYTGDKVGHN